MDGVTEATAAPQEWRAQLHLQFQRRGERTVVGKIQHEGPVYVQRPFYPEAGLCHTYLLHPPGGLVGGDCVHINVYADADAEVLLTTPAATKFYRSRGQPAQQHLRLQLAAGACCEWLPQKTIVFDGALSVSATDIELQPGARLIAWETTCLGRPASQAPYQRGHHDQRLAVHCNGQLIYIERLHLHGNQDAYHALWGLMGHAVTGLLLASPGNQAALTAARATITDYNNDGIYACTLISDLLLCRCLSNDAQSVRRWMTALWHRLRPLVIGREACEPRIWLT